MKSNNDICVPLLRAFFEKDTSNREEEVKINFADLKNGKTFAIVQDNASNDVTCSYVLKYILKIIKIIQ